MTNYLSLCNRPVGDSFLGVLATKKSANISAMKDPFHVDFGRRLGAAMAAAGIPNAALLANLINQPASRVRNWVNGTSAPPAKDAVILAQALGVTLDWLYREHVDGLSEAKRIRLVAAMQGLTVPAVLGDEDLDHLPIGRPAAAPAAVPSRSKRRRRGQRAISD